MKISIDLLMFLALLFLMPYEMVGETAHEWIGMAIFILFILHHLMNRRWTGNIRKGRYTPVRVIQTVLAFVLLILMIGSMISGILLSRRIFKSVNIAGTANLARNVHMICAYWGFVLMAVHLGIHWNMFIGMLQKRTGTWIGKKLWALRILAFAIAAYGMHAFIIRDIGSYMFLKNHFVFLDFTEPVIFLLRDYFAAAGLFVLLGHYLGKAARYCGK